MSRLTQCIMVKKGKDGSCKCAKYAPAGTISKTFEQLCKEQNLNIKVGKTIKNFNDLDLGGSIMARKKRKIIFKPRRRRGFREYDDLGDDLGFDFGDVMYDEIDNYLDDTDGDFSFVDELADALGVDMQEVKEIAVVGGSAAAAGVAWSFLETKFLDNLVAGKTWGNYAKVGAKVLAGILVASFLKKYNKPVALGVGAGLVGSAFGDLFKKVMPNIAGAPASTAPSDIGYTLPEAEEMPVAGYLSQGEEDTAIPVEGVEEEKLYGVEEEKPFYGVEEEKLYGVEEEKLYGLDDEREEIVF